MDAADDGAPKNISNGYVRVMNDRKHMTNIVVCSENSSGKKEWKRNTCVRAGRLQFGVTEQRAY